MLVDHTTISVCSGRGGRGSSSLRREKYIPKGGPDGGDGGDGGSVVFVGDAHLDTLAPFARRGNFKAESGRNGASKECYGRRGADLELPVPLGCQIFDEAGDQLLADIVHPDQRFVVAPGGKGGRGNMHFATSTHQTPTEFEEGGEPVELRVRLELKLIADAGLVGLPNAGKSTMLSRISHAQPKIADYPFTTLVPQLGMVDLPGERRLVVADIPGLIEGASGGAGLGHDFLRHIERTSLLVHLLDSTPPDGSDPVQNYRTIRNELATFSPELAEKPEIIALNKIELVDADEREAFVEQVAGQLGFPRGERPLVVSGATGEGVRELLEACWTRLAETKAARAGNPEGAGWGKTAR